MVVVVEAFGVVEGSVLGSVVVLARVVVVAASVVLASVLVLQKQFFMNGFNRLRG